MGRKSNKKQKQKQEKEQQIQQTIADIPEHKQNIAKRIIIALASVVVIGLAAFFLYSDVTDFDMVYCDDNIFVLKMYDQNKDPDAAAKAFSETMGTTYYRPILNLSLVWDSNIAENADCTRQSISPRVFHRTNLILHILSSALVFLFIWRLGYHWIFGLLFGLLMAVHPILTPAASWISGRNDSLITVSAILSFIFLISYYDTKNTVMGAVYLLLNLVFYAATLFTKEIGAFYPFVAAVYILLFRKEKLLSKKNIIVVACWFVIGLVWNYMRLEATKGINNPDTIGLEALVQNYPTLFTLFGKIFIPYRMIALSTFEMQSIMIGIGMLAIFILLIVLNKKMDKRRIAFGLSWFVLFLFPTFLVRILNVGDFFDYAEHRAYLVMVGLFIALIEIFKGYKIKPQNPVFIGVFAAVLIFFGYTAYGYKAEFHDRFTFWGHMVETYPTKPRGYFDLGKAYLNDNDHVKAEELYLRGIELNPNNKNLYIDMGLLKNRQQKWDEAEYYSREALKLAPKDFTANWNLARAYSGQGKVDEALLIYDGLSARNKRYYQVYTEHGVLYMRKQRFEDAINMFKRSLMMHDRDFYTYFRMGDAYAGLNNYKDAEICWRNAITLNPKNSMAYRSMMIYKYNTQEYDEVRKYIKMLRDNGGKLWDDLHQLFVEKNIISE